MSADALSLGEVTATFKLVDQLTPALKASKASVLEFRDGLYQVVPAADAVQSKVSGAVPTLEELNKKYGITNDTFKDTNKTVKQSASLFDEFSSGLIKGLLGGAAIAGLASVAAKSIEAAGNLVAMAQGSGIAATELDRLQRIGEPTHTTLDQIGRAADFLGQKLTDGDKSTRGALDAVGLSIETLLSKNPTQRFLDVAKAIGAIEDPAARAAAAAKLLGSADLGAFATNVSTAAQQVGQMTDETIANLARLDRAWASTKRGFADFIGGMLGDLSGFTTSWRGFWGDIVGALPGALGQNLKGYVQGVFDMREGIDKALPSAKDLQRTFDAQHASLKPLPESLGDAKAAEAEFTRTMGDAEKQLRNSIKANDDHTKAIQALADTYTGKNLKQKVDDITQALSLAEKQGGLTAYEYQQLGKELVDLKNKGALLPPKLDDIRLAEAKLEFQTKVTTNTHETFQRVLKDYPKAALPAFTTISDLNAEFMKLVRPITDVHRVIDELSPTIHDLPAPPVDPWKIWHDAAKINLEDIQQIALSAISGIGSAFGENITNMIAGTVSLHDGLVGIWDGIKSAFFNLVDQMISYWINKLVVQAIGSWASAMAGLGGPAGGVGGFGGFGGLGAGVGSGVGGAGTGIGLSSPSSGAATAAGTGLSIGAIAGTAGGIGIVFGLGAALNGTGLFGQGSYTEGQRPSEYNGPSTGYYDNGQIDPYGQYGYQLGGDQRQSDTFQQQFGGGSGLTFGDESSGPMDWRWDVPNMATGGMVKAKPGGTRVNLAEGGQDEYVIPASQMGGWGARSAPTVLNIDLRGALMPNQFAMRDLVDMLVPYLPGGVNAYVSR